MKKKTYYYIDRDDQLCYWDRQALFWVSSAERWLVFSQIEGWEAWKIPDTVILLMGVPPRRKGNTI